MMTDKVGLMVLGEVTKSVEVGGFILTETVRAPRLTLPRHFHEHTNIAFVIKGSFIETVGKHPHECSPSSLIMKPAGEVHSNQYGREEARCLIIEVKPQRQEMIRQVSNVLDRAVHVRGGSIPVLAKRIYKEFRGMDSASALSIEALTLEMLARATRRDSSDLTTPIPSWLREARDLLHEQFAQPVSLSGVAESVGVHPAHLAKMFRKYYRCTVGDYVRRLRLDYAMQELTQSNQALVEIALAAGFYDQSHFTHAFKRHTGMAPAEFRTAIRTSQANTKSSRFSKTS